MKWAVAALLVCALALAALAGSQLLAAGTARAAARPATAAAAPNLLVPAPNDSAWVEYYRNRQEGVRMAVHLPATRMADSIIVWEKYAEARTAVIALAQVHYDCRQRTRRSEKIALYRDGRFNGYAYQPKDAEPVPVEADSVEDDALGLACFGKSPAVVDDDP